MERNASEHQLQGRMSNVLAAALGMALTMSLAPVAGAGPMTPPQVPSNIVAPAGNKAFLLGHAIGTQNYICVPSATSASGVAWKLFTPQATLFNDDGKELTTHYFSPNRFEANSDPKVVVTDGMIRATWQHSKDSSIVWAKLHVHPNGTAASVVVDPAAIPWLLLDVVNGVDGPEGGDALSDATFIQRLNTTGGLAPSQGCSMASQLGNSAFVPYTADYVFYARD